MSESFGEYSGGGGPGAREIRKAIGLTQVRVADLARVVPWVVSWYEKRLPSTPVQRRTAKAFARLDMTYRWLASAPRFEEIDFATELHRALSRAEGQRCATHQRMIP